ncbi:MAG: hypothetical protein V1659_02185 [Candidatus Woesearchaeota archaeon]
MKRILIVLLAVLALILTGCNQNEGPSVSDPYIGGTEGLKMSLREGTPPEQIFDNGKYPFSIIVDLENVGEDDIEANGGIVRVVGLLPQHFGYSGQFVENIPEIPGAKKNFEGTALPGEKNAVAFENLNYQNDLSGNTQLNYRIEACYNYQTRSTTPICIKDDVIGNIGDETICKLNEEKAVKNSGGPVHITSVRETPSGENKVQLLITVSHVGTGTIFQEISAWGADGICKDTVTNQDKNIVHVTVDLPGNAPASVVCTGLEGVNAGATEGDLTLFRGEPRKFTCTVTGNGNGNIYQELLSVNLDYAYSSFIDSVLLIQDVTDS